MTSKHSKLKKSGSGRTKSMSRDRCKRLGKMLCWVGKRYPGDDEDVYHQKVVWPTNLMHRDQMIDVVDWVLNTPNRWRLTVNLYMEDKLKNKYIDTFEYETSQQFTSEELSDWRYEKIKEARADNSVNMNNLIAETFEARIV